MFPHKQIFIIAIFFISACSGLIQTASISEAYKSFEKKDFSRTLELISQAEAAQVATPETQAELTYLKAQSYAMVGKEQSARALYKFLSEQHRETQYGYLASKALDSDTFR